MGSIPRVALYYSSGCHLCERAKATLSEVRAEHDFELEEVNVDGVLELEERYREWLPVVEIDGRRAFVYHVDAAAFVRKLHAQSEAP